MSPGVRGALASMSVIAAAAAHRRLRGRRVAFDEGGASMGGGALCGSLSGAQRGDSPARRRQR